MDLEETLETIVENARKELHVVRMRTKRRPRREITARIITRPRPPLTG